MKNKVCLMLGVLILGILLIGLGSAADMCPLNSEDYDQIVNIGDGKLRSDLTISDARSAVIPLVLGPGKYSVTLVARDESLSRGDDFQPNEQYQLSFLREGIQVALTSSTSDLEDNVIFSEIVEIVETGLSLPTGADSVQAVHSQYNSVPTDSPNSLYAVCVGIKKIIEEPTCDYDAGANYNYGPSNGTGIAIGYETGSDWMEGFVNLFSNETYDVKLSIKNFGSNSIENLYILFKIDGNYLNSFYKNLSVSSSASYQKFEFDSSAYSCGFHTISAELSKENQIDCNSENNYASREIYIQCNGEEPPEPSCGDGVCEVGESCLTCPLDCGLCEEIFTDDNETKKDNDEDSDKNFDLISFGCFPNWECSIWGECVNSVQTRTCVDKNKCVYEYGKPSEISSCLEGITPLESKVQDFEISIWVFIGLIALVILLLLLLILFA